MATLTVINILTNEQKVINLDETSNSMNVRDIVDQNCVIPRDAAWHVEDINNRLLDSHSVQDLSRNNINKCWIVLGTTVIEGG